MAIEMASHELIDLRLARRVQVLEFVHSLEFHNIKPIRQDPIGLPLQQMFALVSCDM